MKIWVSPELGKGYGAPGSPILMSLDPPQSGGPGTRNHGRCEGRGMTGQMLTESRGRREGLGSVCMWQLRDLSLSLHPYEMGWQVPHEL